MRRERSSPGREFSRFFPSSRKEDLVVRLSYKGENDKCPQVGRERETEGNICTCIRHCLRFLIAFLAPSDERKGVLRTEDRHAVQQVNSCGTLISDVAAYIYFFL